MSNKKSVSQPQTNKEKEWNERLADALAKNTIEDFIATYYSILQACSQETISNIVAKICKKIKAEDLILANALGTAFIKDFFTLPNLKANNISDLLIALLAKNKEYSYSALGQIIESFHNIMQQSESDDYLTEITSEALKEKKEKYRTAFNQFIQQCSQHNIINIINSIVPLHQLNLQFGMLEMIDDQNNMNKIIEACRADDEVFILIFLRGMLDHVSDSKKFTWLIDSMNENELLALIPKDDDDMELQNLKCQFIRHASDNKMIRLLNLAAEKNIMFAEHQASPFDSWLLKTKEPISDALLIVCAKHRFVQPVTVFLQVLSREDIDLNRLVSIINQLSSELENAGKNIDDFIQRSQSYNIWSTRERRCYQPIMRTWFALQILQSVASAAEHARLPDMLYNAPGLIALGFLSLLALTIDIPVFLLSLVPAMAGLSLKLKVNACKKDVDALLQPITGKEHNVLSAVCYEKLSSINYDATENRFFQQQDKVSSSMGSMDEMNAPMVQL